MTDSTAAPRTVRLSEYRAPDFLIDTVELTFDIRDGATVVTSSMAMRRNPQMDGVGTALILDGQQLRLVRLALDGQEVGANRYAVDEDSLTVHDLPDRFMLDVTVEIDPAANTALEGLYLSGGTYVTQCEAEGFRRITYFLDRPDVLARYTTTIVADRGRFPVLLSNGNPVDAGDAPDGRHWARWEDPFPKPSYLFALVAADLRHIEDCFVTRSGRTIALRIYVRAADLGKCDHAMRSLKAAMEWDERVYGFEYDLDLFMIVAVSDFNMGAMENKGLNIFNTALVLASPATATDADYARVETVVSHEYFHNWTGDRITCRDWFQLSLKEGLTVFRDQEFSSDMNSRPVKRIEDVRRLRAIQFPEDAGPMAHPIRPESYIEINNFYTPTVYEKGAEVIRMIHTMLGADAYRAGIDLYVERHDGQAATCEDFVRAMEDAGGQDLTDFRRWYAQAGTPEVSIAEAWDEADGRYTLSLRQETPPTPGQAEKLPVVMPVALGLLDGGGRDVPVRLEGEDDRPPGTRILRFSRAEESFVFIGLAARPTPSILRGFSAPVRLDAQPQERLAFLFRHDSDPFNRWEAGQQLAAASLLAAIGAGRASAAAIDPSFVDAVAAMLSDPDADPAFVAEAAALPSESYLADQMRIVDVDAIHRIRETARAAVAGTLRPVLEATYRRYDDRGAPVLGARAAGRRALKNLCLWYLAAIPGDRSVRLPVLHQAESGTTMTDVLAAMAILRDFDWPERARLLAAFYDRWAADDLVIDKWFSLQAMAALPGTLETVRGLMAHRAFTLRTPNRARSLIGSFTMGNPLHFHRADGAGYAFLAEQVLTLDDLNPQFAARTLVPLGRWQRQDSGRQALMRQALERILAKPGLSPDVYEDRGQERCLTATIGGVDLAAVAATLHAIPACSGERRLG